jgi:cyclic pyranopterin phosphate synthase
MTTEGLVDGFGRVHTDLRVSITDKCSLRCTYCMPAEGVPYLPNDTTLSLDEMIRVARVAVGLGIRTIRLTGGEPLVRHDIVDIVREIKALDPTLEIALTTNGLKLPELAEPLRSAGLERVNVSLDTLDPKTFAKITRRDRFDDVIAGLQAAKAAGLNPLKLNSVLLRGVNDFEAPDIVRYALREGYEPRFIEQMPLGPAGEWTREGMVTAADIIEILGRDFFLEPTLGRKHAPAERWRVRPRDSDKDAGLTGMVGIVAAVTENFCGQCNRVRLTSDGQLRACLFSDDETDLRGMMRSGASDDELAAAMRACVAHKWAGHGINSPSFHQPHRPMSAIGG